jgi:hypothetical protein
MLRASVSSATTAAGEKIRQMQDHQIVKNAIMTLVIPEKGLWAGGEATVEIREL